MTDPHSSPDLILAAREIVKTWLPPSFVKAIDAGDLDPWGLMERAKVEALKKRADAPDTEGGEE